VEKNMARFTVEDCMKNIENRFDMTLATAVRAKQLCSGNRTLLADDENDKPIVLALREISQNLVGKDLLNKILE
jgi:DNA-directed RNA polymerase subunit omega